MTAHGAAASPPGPTGVRALFGLVKLRLNSLAVFAVAAGWWVESGSARPVGRFVAAMVGAVLLSFGASALNQWLEMDRDARMVRTRDRPLPSGRVSPAAARAFGVSLVLTGLVILVVWTTPLAFGIGALTVGTYLGVYTPLKSRTSLNTLVGTIPGALPPLLGAAAATGALGPRAWFLFALVAAWQLPHFLAIAWMYRADYALGGFAMLPVVTQGSGATARQVLVQALLTVVVSLAAVPLEMAGRVYFFVALAAGVLLAGAALLFAVRPGVRTARTLLRASLVHLPLVLVAFALFPR